MYIVDKGVTADDPCPCNKSVDRLLSEQIDYGMYIFEISNFEIIKVGELRARDGTDQTLTAQYLRLLINNIFSQT